jgi:glycosyltransferase involved in cell wall biosynthesis
MNHPIPTLAGRTIAIVVNTSWNIYNFRGGLVRELIRQGATVIALAPPDEFSQRLVDELGVTFVPLRRLSRKGTNPAQDMRLMFELVRIYRRYRVDVALHYTIKPVIYGSLAARLTGVRNISTLTGLGYAFITPGLVNRVVRGLYRQALRSAHWTYFQNADDHRLFLDGRMVPIDRSGIISGSGINTDHFQPGTDPGDESLIFLFVGRLLFDKGIVEFHEAARSLRRIYPEAQFHVVGGLDPNNPSAVSAEMLQLWKDSGDIIYHGQVSDTRPFIAASTAVVLPSYREGLPRVMLEGMSMGKPLVATDVPGCRETVVDGENGFLVTVRDAGSLARGMEKIIQLGAAERREMGRRGRELALHRFAEPVIVAEYLLRLTEDG